MKKLLSILVLSVLSCNLVVANSSDQKQIYNEYLQKIFNSAVQKNEKKFKEVCSQFSLGKNQKQITGYNYKDPGTSNIVNSNILLDYMCTGFEPAIGTFVGQYNHKFNHTDIPHSKLCFEYMKFSIGNEFRSISSEHSFSNRKLLQKIKQLDVPYL